MPTDADLKASADATLSIVRTATAALQERHKELTGKYFQVLPGKPDAKGMMTWTDEVWTPDGVGRIENIRITANGKTMTKAVWVGPASHGDMGHDWVTVTPEESIVTQEVPPIKEEFPELLAKIADTLSSLFKVG